ncbi:MAG: hypothetical protein ACE5FK_03730, partial [Candidatus Methylomirabilia bacterium]
MVGAADTIYRMVYRGVFCRLAERRAVLLGQSLLQFLPLDRVPLFRLTDPRLVVVLGGVRLPNPLILSSMYY